MMYSSRALAKLIGPLIVERFLSVTMGIANAFMVSSVSEAAISGVSIVDAINYLLIQIFAALATGGAVVVSQYLGSKKREQACAAAKQLFAVMLTVSLVLTAAALIWCRQTLRLVYGNIDSDVMANAETYFRLSALSYPFLALYNAGAALFRSMNNSRISMFTALIMNIINIGGNSVLIYVYNMSVAGAGTSSLVASIFAAAAVTYLITRKKYTVHVEKLFKPEINFPMIKRILRIGIPNGIENGLFQIGKLLVQGLITLFGTSAIAANAVSGNITNVVTIPGIAIQLALVTVAGQCIGAGEYGQAKYYTKKLVRISYVSIIILSAAIYFFAVPVTGLFKTLSPDAAENSVRILRSFALFASVIWVPSFVPPNTMRASGDVKFTMMVSVLSMGVFRVGFAYIMVKYFFSLGMITTWYAMYLDWLVRSIIFTVHYKRNKWMNARVI